MAVQYKKKIEKEDERTVDATEFINRLMNFRKMPDRVRQEPQIESKE